MSIKAPDTDPVAEFDAYRNTYDAAVNEALSFSGLKVDFFTRVKADYLLDTLDMHFGSARRANLLDVGCGVGNYHELLRGKVSSITGVDISGECLACARERNLGVAYHRYDGRKLPFPDNSFHAAFTICVMHHVPPSQWAEFVSEMRRVVRPGGLAAVFEHNPANPLTRRVVNQCAFDKDAVLLREGTTANLLKDAGFEGVRSQFILNVPAGGRVLRAIDRLASPLRLGAQYFTVGQKPAK